MLPSTLMILPCGCSNIWFRSVNSERSVNNSPLWDTSGLFLPSDPWWKIRPFETRQDYHTCRILFLWVPFFGIAPMPKSYSHLVWDRLDLCSTWSISVGGLVPQCPPSRSCLLGCFQVKGGWQKWQLVQQLVHEISYCIVDNIEETFHMHRWCWYVDNTNHIYASFICVIMWLAWELGSM